MKTFLKWFLYANLAVIGVLTIMVTLGLTVAKRTPSERVHDACTEQFSDPIQEQDCEIQVISGALIADHAARLERAARSAY